LAWCRRGDSNPHGLPHTPLKRTCLPVPPLRHYSLLCRRLFLLSGCSTRIRLSRSRRLASRRRLRRRRRRTTRRRTLRFRTWRRLRHGRRACLRRSRGSRLIARRCDRRRRRHRRLRLNAQRPAERFLAYKTRDRKEKRYQEERYRRSHGDLSHHGLSSTRTESRGACAAAKDRGSVRFPRLQQHKQYQHQARQQIQRDQ
jgi:hypothetical protein